MMQSASPNSVYHSFQMRDVVYTLVQTRTLFEPQNALNPSETWRINLAWVLIRNRNKTKECLHFVMVFMPRRVRVPECVFLFCSRIPQCLPAANRRVLTRDSSIFCSQSVISPRTGMLTLPVNWTSIWQRSVYFCYRNLMLITLLCTKHWLKTT